MKVKEFLKTKSDSFLIEKEGTVLLVPSKNDNAESFVTVVEMDFEMPLAITNLETILNDHLTICTLYNPFVPLQYRKYDIY